MAPVMVRPLRIAVIGGLVLSASCGTRVADVDHGSGALPPGGPSPTTSVTGTVESAAPVAPTSPSPAGTPTAATAAPTPARQQPSRGAATGSVAAGGTERPVESKGPSAAGADRLPPPSRSPGGVTPPGEQSRRRDIVIGSVGTLSGPAGAMLKDSVQAVQIWAQMTNDRGGLGGHAVKYLVADDGADPARHRALLQELVERRGVIAFVQNQEGFTGASAADYPTAQRIPVINTESSQSYVYNSPMYFPVTPAGDEYSLAVVSSVADVAASRHLTKLGIIACVEVPAVCEQAARVWSSDRGAGAVGLKLVYQAQTSFTQPDYTAECLNARKAGAEVVMLALDTNSILRLATSCLRQGYQPLYGYPSISARSSLHDLPALDGSVAGTHTFAWPAADTPARKEFHDAFARYAAGTEVTGGHANGWVAAKAFETAAARLPEEPTTEAVLDGLWSLKGNDLGGLTYPLTFTRGQLPPRRSCRSVVIARAGRWEAPVGGNLICSPRAYGER